MSTAATQEIVFVDASGAPSGTQYFVFDCEDGRPSAVGSVTVYDAWANDDGDTLSATTGSAAVDTSPNTTLSAAAGALESSPVALTVTSGTGFAVGGRYQITEDSTGVSEHFEAAGVNGTAITARHPLKNNYTSGAVVVSCRSKIAVDTSWIADESNVSPAYSPNPSYRLRWVATVGGVVQVYDRYADLVRYPSRHGVTPIDVERVNRGWLDRLPPDHQVDQGRGLIDAAFDSVKFELYRDHKADQAIRNAELIARLVAKRCAVELLEDDAMRGAGNADALQVARDGWRAFYEGVIQSAVAPVSESGGGGSVPITPSNWTRR